ncbi:hypothetical protein HYQ46_004713 [Verticillium longisporum]|nr:hypothetical protein HYQ46_004713 [Verticillium longisporum]
MVSYDKTPFSLSPLAHGIGLRHLPALPSRPSPPGDLKAPYYVQVRAHVVSSLNTHHPPAIHARGIAGTTIPPSLPTTTPSSSAVFHFYNIHVLSVTSHPAQRKAPDPVKAPTTQKHDTWRL